MVIGYVAFIRLSRVASSATQPHPPRWLTPREALLWTAARTSRRRIQIAAGRLAAKVAIAGATRGAPEALSTLEILRGARGEPVAVLQDALPVHLSLAHSSSWAVALASQTHHVGIDIEEERPGLPGDYARWTSWEAYGKLSRTGVAAPPVPNAADGWTVQLATRRWGSVVLSVAWRRPGGG